MKIHELKTWPEYFYDVYAGDKTFEVRQNDRDFSVGDTLILREYDPRTDKYSGRSIRCIVSYVLKNYPALQSGYVVMGFRSMKFSHIHDIKIDFDGVWADATFTQAETDSHHNNGMYTSVHVKITEDIAAYVFKWLDQTFCNDYNVPVSRNLTMNRYGEIEYLHSCYIKSVNSEYSEFEMSFMAMLKVPTDAEIAAYELTKLK